MYLCNFSFLLLIVGLHLCWTVLELDFIRPDIFKSYQSIGFFSKCSGYNNRTVFNADADYVEARVNESLVYQMNFNFVTFDVCNDTDFLIEKVPTI